MFKLFQIILQYKHSDSKADFSGKGDSGEVTIDLDKSEEDIEEISSKKIVLEHTASNILIQ